MFGTERRKDAVVAAIVAAVVFLPFLPLLSGHALFFRDLSLYFFPLRRFVATGLAAGEVRWWNPYVHEGEPLALPAIGYLPDLLQALWPDERAFSLLLALHLPLGAAGAFALARTMGLCRAAAATSGVAYGLGGFALSSVNLYVYCQALGWAPWAVCGLLRASGSPRRWWAGALPVALCASTTGVEMAAQALLVAPLLAPDRKRLPAMAGMAALGLALAAPPLSVVASAASGSARARGFVTDVVLAHSVHPLTLPQVVVSAFHGDTARIAERWWGHNFFPLGFPYVLSLYLGAAVLALAAAGAARGGPRGRWLAGLAAAALLVCLGRWAGWAAVLDPLPFLRIVRYPTKAFFTVHLAAALLAGLGLHALCAAEKRRAWWTLAVAAGAPGLVLAVAPRLPELAPSLARAFAAGYFHPQMPWPERMANLDFMLRDAAAGGAAALALALVAVLGALGRLRPALAGGGAAAIIAADLLRAGAGLNPTLPLAALQPSAETRALAEALRGSGLRVFTCDVGTSPAYLAARARRGDRHLAWTVWASMDTLLPAFNIPLAVPTAYSEDLTMLVAEDRVPRLGEGCADIGPLLGRLRAASTGHVISLDPLSHPELTLSAVLAPPRLAPLRAYVYALASPLPRVAARADDGRALPSPVLDETPARIALRLEAASPGRVFVREALEAGWTATVNGHAAPIERSGGRYMAVPIAAGRSEIVLRYSPRRLPLGLALSAIAALILLALQRPRRQIQ